MSEGFARQDPIRRLQDQTRYGNFRSPLLRSELSQFDNGQPGPAFSARSDFNHKANKMETATPHGP